MVSNTITTPPFTPATAYLLALGFCACYVGSLYVSNDARLKFARREEIEARRLHRWRRVVGADKGNGGGLPKAGQQLDGEDYPTHNGVDDKDGPRERLDNERWRDDPDVIRARLTAVCIASVLCCAFVWGLVYVRMEEAAVVPSLRLTSQYLGLVPSLTLAHLITPTLYLGPLFAMHLARRLPGQRNWSFEVDVWQTFATLKGVRAYVLAPVTEEIVFRACVLSVFHMAHMPKVQMVFLSPLVFGVAHLHHAWDTYNRYGRTRAAVRRAIVGCTIQLAYTSLFGFLAAHLFVETDSLLPAISSHVFCNIMGLPDVAADWGVAADLASARGRVGGRGVRGGGGLRAMLRKAGLVLAYLLGVAGFWLTLTRWTRGGGHTVSDAQI